MCASPTRSPSITLDSARTPADWDAARLLVLDLASFIHERSGLDLRTAQRGFADEVAGLSARYRPPRGRFLLARVDGVAVGSVALRRHDDGSGELERMYVRPGSRGLAIGDRLVRRIVELAAWDGLDRIWLETGVGIMEPAIALSRRHGFVEERAHADPSIDHSSLIRMELALPARRPVS